MKKIIAFFKSLFTNLEYVPTNIPKRDTSMIVANVKEAEVKEQKNKKAPSEKKHTAKKAVKKVANKTAKKKIK